VTSLSGNYLSFKSNCNLENFKKLVQLRVTLRDQDVDQANCLGQLPNLKEISLTLNISYKKDMDLFFKRFALPKGVELISLNMENISWSNILSKTELKYFNDIDNVISQFQKLQDSLKSFAIYLNDENKACQINEGLIAPVLSHLKCLEEFRYKNTHSGRSGYSYGSGFGRYKYNAAPATYPLDLESQVQSFIKLKNTLRIINIEDVEVSFKGFSDLITTFSQDQINPYDIRISNLCVSGFNLQNFLNILSRVPSKSILDVTVDAEGIDPKDFKEKICSFLEENRNLQGSIYLAFVLPKKLTAADERNLIATARKRTILRSLNVTTKRGAVICDI